MGSKGRIAKEILPIILKNRKPGQYYVEPMAGGFNSICKVVGNRIASDVNFYLISFFLALQSGWKPHSVTREQMEEIKNNKENFPPHLVGWVGFGCSYSGKFFGGYAGTITTKIGTVRNYQEEAIKNAEKQAQEIVGINIFCCNYWELVIPPNSIIYCDPPYKGTEGYRVKFDHDKFWQWCRQMTIEGHVVYISEYTAPEDFECIWSKELSSSLSANGKSGGNKKSTEKLFTYNYGFPLNENLDF